MAEDIRKMKSTVGVKEFEVAYEKPYCVVLDSEYCSMGRKIGYKACQAAGYDYYDTAILLELVPESDVTKADIDEFEKKLRIENYTSEQLRKDPEYIRIGEVFYKAIDIALAKGPCLIHDRASKEEIIKRGYTCLSVFTYGDNIAAKIVRAKLSPVYCHLEKDEDIMRGINEEDQIRINWHRAHSKTEWGLLKAYDLSINTETFGRDFSAELLAKTMR
ncbi:MAG: cytidylate kinase family protein [Solobacterium sp.]|nr:cytidylate kinase family protein [Solobacterium sp.]